MRVVVASSTVIPSPPPPDMYGGLEYVSALRARFLAEYGHEVWVFGAHGSRLGWMLRWGEPPSNVRFVEEVQERDFLKHREILDRADLIVDDGWEGVVAEAYPNKTVKVWHGAYPPRMFALRTKVMHVGVSRAHADLIARTLATTSVGYIYNALDPAEYTFREDKEPYLLFLNRISSEKGAHVFAMLCRELGVRGIIVGEDRVLADRTYVYGLIRDLPHNVEYLGRVPHKVKRDLLSSASALVAPLQPHYFEVFGLYAVEANTSGTPVVALRNGALPEVVVQGESGLLVDTYHELRAAAKKALKGEFNPHVVAKHAQRFHYHNWSPITPHLWPPPQP